MTGHMPTRKNIHDNDESLLAHYERMLHLSRSAMISLDADFQIQTVSESISSLIGYTANVLVGQNYMEFIPSNYHDPFFKLIDDEEFGQFDYPLIAQNGDWHWVRHSGESVDSGTNNRYEFMVQDVSHYKRPHFEAESERNLLRDMMDNLPDAIHATNKDGQFIFSNQAHADLLGQSRPSDVSGLHYRKFFSEELSSRFEAQDKKVISTGQGMLDEEVTYLGDDGERLFSTNKLALYNSEGQIDGVIGITRDITEEKNYRLNIVKSEARHRALLDALPDMMFVIRLDGIVTEFRSTPEVKSLNIDTSIINTNIRNSGLPQALIDKVLLYLDIELDYQYAQSFEFGHNIEEDFEEYFEARLVRLNDEEIIGLVRNVTSLKRIQDELNLHIKDLNIVRQVNVELSATLNDDYVSQLALDSALRLSNAQSGYLAMMQVSGTMVLKDVFGQYNLEALDNTLNPVKGIVARVIENKEPELIFDVHSDEDYIPLLDRTVAMMAIPLISNEQTVGILVLEARRADRFSHERFQFLQLITGRIAAFLDNAMLHRQTEEQYREVRYLEQLKTDMIRIASHDLKNPLAGIMGYMEMFRSEVNKKLDEKERGYLDRIEVAAKKMQRIISGILSLERIQQLSEQQSVKPINLKKLVNRSVSEQMDYAVRSEQTLHRHLSEEDIYIVGDALQIHEALSNLVGNAIKYSPKQGTVDVSLLMENGIAKVRVKDTGYGIPLDQQERLFAPFFRAKTRETRFIEGTGLGLHLVKNIIERHGGEMVFESEYGKGSTFGFNMPAIVNSGHYDKD